MTLTARDKFWSKVNKTDTCWLWNNLPEDKYGFTSYEGKKTSAHRLSYTLLVGEIPEGLVIDHLCGVKACCNPKHLEPVTFKENIRRGSHRGSLPKRNVLGGLCKNSHLLEEKTALTIYHKPSPTPVLVCRICAHERYKRRRVREGYVFNNPQ